MHVVRVQHRGGSRAGRDQPHVSHPHDRARASPRAHARPRGVPTSAAREREPFAAGASSSEPTDVSGGAVATRVASNGGGAPAAPAPPRRRTRSRSDRWWSTRDRSPSRGEARRGARATRGAVRRSRQGVTQGICSATEATSFAWRRVTSRIASSPRARQGGRRRRARRGGGESRGGGRVGGGGAKPRRGRCTATLGDRRSRPPGDPPPRGNFFAAEGHANGWTLLRTLPRATDASAPTGTEPSRPGQTRTPNPPIRETFFRRTRAVDVHRGDVPSESARDGRRHRASAPRTALRGASRGVRSNVPRAIERFRAVSRLRRRRTTPRIITSPGLSHASPRRDPSSAPRRGDPTRVGPDARRDRSLGGTRSAAAPSWYYREKAVARNARYDDVEGIARRPLRTTSTGSRASRDRGEQFELSPAHVHFGRVPVGSTTARVALLTNVSPDLGRFSLRPPDPEGPFRVKFAPGLVSPGLAARLKVTCAATRPGEYVDASSSPRRRRCSRSLCRRGSRGWTTPCARENSADGGRPERETSERFRTRDDVGVRLDPNLTLDELRERARFGGRR